MANDRNHAEDPIRLPRHWLAADATRRAALIAGLYLVAGIGYILLSSWVVALVAGSVEEAHRLEAVKGITFIAVTAAVLFALCRWMLSRIEAQYARIALQFAAAHNADRALLAGTFASSISHDINNALTSSLAALGEIEARIGADPALVEDLGVLRQSLEDITAWNRRTFDLGARRRDGDMTDFDLAELVGSCVRLARKHERLSLCTVTLGPMHEPASLVGHEHLVRRAVLNLILNAAEAGGAGCRIELAVTNRDGRPTIVVEDDGPGVPPELKARILEPFFTTKSDGSGVGMTSVLTCAEAHGGDVLVGDSAAGGARFELRLAPAANDR